MFYSCSASQTVDYFNLSDLFLMSISDLCASFQFGTDFNATTFYMASLFNPALSSFLSIRAETNDHYQSRYLFIC